MKLIVTGSGDAFNGAGRGHSCYWIERGAAAPIMVDFGATALMALERLHLDPRRLSAVLVTHPHGDHIGGLAFLAIDACFHRPRTEPLRIFGPPGLSGRFETLLRACYPSLLERDEPLPFEFAEIDPGAEVVLDDIRVRPFAGEHGSGVGGALGYRLQVGPGGPVLVFSGDTEMTDALLAAANGADVLVAECSALEGPAPGHCSWSEWRRALPGLDVGRVLLTHLPEAVRRAVPGELPLPGPPVELAEDGRVIDLPVR